MQGIQFDRMPPFFQPASSLRYKLGIAANLYETYIPLTTDSEL